MGYQVIRQPDGNLAVFSSITDTWVVYDACAEEVVDWFAEAAARDARREAERKVSAVLHGKPEQVYYQFAKSFTEANEQSAEHGGIAWVDGWPEVADVLGTDDESSEEER